MTLFIAFLFFYNTSPICLSTHDDVIELNAPSSYKNSNGNYKNLKYVYNRIPYNVNSTATFHIELLKSMYINPNSGPSIAEHNIYNNSSTPPYVFPATELVSLNQHKYGTKLPKLPNATWNIINTLEINRIPKNRHTTREGRRKPWNHNI